MQKRFLLLAIVIYYFSLCDSKLTANITIYNKIINTTDTRLVSFNLDYGSVYRIDGLNYSDDTFNYVVSQLSPSLLRVGGTSSDFAVYEVGSQNPCKLPPISASGPYNRSYTCFNMSQLNKLIKWSKNVNTQLIWTLASYYPNFPNSSMPNWIEWNSSNAYDLLVYLHDTMHYDWNDIYGFEIGNEINYGDPFWDAGWQSKAYHQLNDILVEIWGNNHQFKLFGPAPHSGTVRDYANQSVFDYIPNFYNATCDILYGGDYHSYLNENKTFMITPQGLNLQYHESIRVSNIWSDPNSTFNTNPCLKKLKNNIFAGELGPENWVSNFTNVTNGYYNGFWFLDALSTISRLGQNGAWRWVLYSNLNNELSPNENLLGYEYNPNPDYYTGLLFKWLMGTNVIGIESDYEYLRIYAHCTSDYINEKIYNQNQLNLSNAVTISYINIDENNEILININEVNGLLLGEVIAFILTPYDKNSGIESLKMELNGDLLELDSDGKLPDLEGKFVNMSQTQNKLVVPSMTYGYFVFTKTQFTACQG